MSWRTHSASLSPANVRSDPIKPLTVDEVPKISGISTDSQIIGIWVRHWFRAGETGTSSEQIIESFPSPVGNERTHERK